MARFTVERRNWQCWPLYVVLLYIFTLFHDVTLVNAVISFPSGLTVAWEGQPLGSLQMNDVHVVGNVGASIDTNSLFTVVNVTHLTDFTQVPLSFNRYICFFTLPRLF